MGKKNILFYRLATKYLRKHVLFSYFFFFAPSRLKAAGDWVFAGCNDSRGSSSRRSATRRFALLPLVCAECPQFTDGHFA